MRAAVTAGLMLLMACGKAPGPAPAVRTCESTLRFAPENADAGMVSVRGEWNGFTAEPMTRRPDGVFEWKKTLEYRSAGYAYRFLLGDGSEMLDATAHFTRWAGTTEHSRLRVPDCTLPSIEVNAFHADASEVHVEFATFRGTTSAALRTPVVTFDGTASDVMFNAETGSAIFSLPNLSAGKHTVKISLSDVADANAEPVFLPFWVEAKPFTFEGATMYFVFTDRFRNGDQGNDKPSAGVDTRANYQGGDFKGVTAAINDGYFDRLGVTVLWLSPPEMNPDEGYGGTDGRQYSGYHGYWPMGPRAVQSRFGTISDLKDLVHAAHAHSIRVITDLVLNHVHEKHPWYAQHRDDDWFNTATGCVCGSPGCDWDTHALTCWFTPYLPDLNWKNTPMSDAFTADVRWWLEEADVDGFRLDAVRHLERTGTRAIRGTVSEYSQYTGLPYFLVGETFTSVDGRDLIKSYIGPQLLDGQFDFPLYWVVVDVFARGQSMRQLDTALTQNEATYAAGTVNSAFLGNHDVSRFISYAAGEIQNDPLGQAWNSAPGPSVQTDEPFYRAKMAFAFLLSQPGIPLIYYGDEVGMPGAGDPDNRRFMKWTNLSSRESDLLTFMQQLGTARKNNDGLRMGKRSTLFVDDDLLIIQRVSQGHSALLVLNRGSARTQLVSTNLGPGTHVLKDAFTGQMLTVQGSTSLTIPARAIQVFTE